MASRTCWNCNVLTQLDEGDEPEKMRGLDVWSLDFRCTECGAMSIGMLDGEADDEPGHVLWRIENETPQIRWIPSQAPGKVYVDVPPHIADTADEAHRCHSIAASRAAILLARSVIEATAKDKGVASGSLLSKIDSLHAAGYVNELVRDLAHEARHFGNDMAHGDFIVPISEQDAEDVLGIMSEVLREVYQSPANLLRIREGRLAREAASKVE